jgi:FkbM family methyltransferase
MENLREIHNLLDNDLFFVIGGHEGDISTRILKKYNPYTYIFEPSKVWFDFLVEKYKNNNKVTVFNFGFAKNEGEYKLFKVGNGDGSNIYQESPEFEIVKLKKMSDFLNEDNISKVKLIEFNCEGAEYEIIEELSNNNKLNVFDAIQVQCHKINEYQKLYQNFSSQLSVTHKKEWGVDFIWECWKLK